MVNAFLHNALYLLRFSTEKARNKFSFTSQELVSHLTGEMKTICPIRSHWQSFAFQIVRKIIIKIHSQSCLLSQIIYKGRARKDLFLIRLLWRVIWKAWRKKKHKRENKVRLKTFKRFFWETKRTTNEKYTPVAFEELTIYLRSSFALFDVKTEKMMNPHALDASFQVFGFTLAVKGALPYFMIDFINFD